MLVNIKKKAQYSRIYKYYLKKSNFLDRMYEIHLLFWRKNKKLQQKSLHFQNQIKFLTLTFMGPCIVSIVQYISNKMQCYTVYFIWKLLYMFRVVLPPIIRSADNYIYGIWYLSHRYCYLSMTNTRCCRYSYLRFWWWVEVPPEICRAVPR
jgi:hypothetical protein